MDHTQHKHEDRQEDLPSYKAAPPPYADAGAGPEQAGAAADHARVVGYDAADDLVKPGILVLDGQRIYAASDPTTAIYELNRGITNLSYATRVIEFTRIEQRHGGVSADGVPTIRLRPRHIYNLYNSYRLISATPSKHAEFFIRSMAAPSRRLGHLGLKKSRAVSGPTSHWTAMPINLKGGNGNMEQVGFVPGMTSLWEAHSKQGACKWTDMAGNDAAIEYDTDRVQLPQLLVTASLQREHLDALVALWCCRIWDLTLRGQPFHTVKTRSFVSFIGS